MNRRGWIRLYRESLQSDKYKDPIAWQVWTYLMLSANFKTRTLRNGLTLKPGDLWLSVRKLSEELKISRSTISRYFQIWCHDSSINVTRFGRKGIVVSLCNWETYNSGPEEKPEKRDQFARQNEARCDAEKKKFKKFKKEGHAADPASRVAAGREHGTPWRDSQGRARTTGLDDADDMQLRRDAGLVTWDYIDVKKGPRSWMGRIVNRSTGLWERVYWPRGVPWKGWDTYSDLKTLLTKAVDGCGESAREVLVRLGQLPPPPSLYRPDEKAG